MAKAKDKESIIQDITNRFRVTAREARDIVTAVGTIATVNRNPTNMKYAKANLKQQVQEAGAAATKGKKGTRSNQKSGRGIVGMNP